MKALSRPAFLAFCFSAGATATPLFAANGTWSALTSGTYNWSSTGNWQSGTVASGQGAVATLPLQNSASTGVTINLDTNETVGAINISGNKGGYTISGANTLTIDNGASSGTISLASGSLAANISVPIALNTDLAITDAASQGINISSNITGAHNITLNNSSTGIIALTNGSGVINNGGAITNLSSGSGGIGINLSDIGSNVTGIIQDASGTSIMSLSGTPTTNSFTGSITTNEGTIRITNLTLTNNVVYVGSGGTVDMNNGAATVAGIGDGAVVGGTFENSNTAANKNLTLAGSGSYSFGGTLSGGINLGVNSGTTQTLTGTASYLGTTSISGTLIVDANGSTVTHAVTVNSGGTLGGNGSLGAPVTVSAGGNINLVDNGIGTLTVGGLTSSGTSGTASTFTFEIGTSAESVDSISTGTLTLSNANGTKIVIDNLNNVASGSQSLVNGTYDLITYSSTLTGSLADLSLQTTSLDGHTLMLTSLASGELVLTVSGGSVNTYYFAGADGSNSFTDGANYYTTAAGTTQQSSAPSSSSDVYLNANSASHTPVTLNTTSTVNSLNFVTGGTSLAGNGSLTVEGASDGTVTNGIADSATGGTTETIDPTVVLGASQSWSVSNSSNTLAVTGGITGSSGQTLTLNGPGSYNFSGTASGAFNTTVSSGKLLLTNTSGSAIGTGALSVSSGSTIGGQGSATGLSSFAIGSGSTTRTQVIVGSGSDTTTNLTLQASGASTITYANLAFNLSSATAHQGNELVLNNSGGTGTPLTIASTTVTLNLTGSNVILANTSYVLLYDNSGFSGLTTNGGSDLGSSTADVITGGLTIAANSFFNASSGNGLTNGGFYSGSYLYLTDGGDQIDVMVVPEPSTWAMMFSGFAALIFWQRRKARRE